MTLSVPEECICPKSLSLDHAIPFPKWMRWAIVCCMLYAVWAMAYGAMAPCEPPLLLMSHDMNLLATPQRFRFDE